MTLDDIKLNTNISKMFQQTQVLSYNAYKYCFAGEICHTGTHVSSNEYSYSCFIDSSASVSSFTLSRG